MKSILIALFFILSACSTQQPVGSIPTVYTSTWKQDYDNAVMIKCRNEAIHFTLLMYEARTEEWSTEDVMRVEHFVFTSCLKYNNQFI